MQPIGWHLAIFRAFIPAIKTSEMGKVRNLVGEPDIEDETDMTDVTDVTNMRCMTKLQRRSWLVRCLRWYQTMPKKI